MSLRLENIAKTFKTPNATLQVLTGLNLEIRDKEMWVIFGKSGAGKSTLLNLLGGMDTPTAGKVSVDGVDLSGLKPDALAQLRKDKIGYVFQAFNLLSNLKAKENIILPVMLDKEREKKISRIMQLAEEWGIKERLSHLPAELSLGEQQRVAILRALINSPSIILADEPTAHLDNENATRVIELFKKLNREQGVTCVIVTDHEAIASQFEHRFNLG